VKGGTVLLVRDFRLAAAQELVAAAPEKYAIEEEAPVDDRAALTAEKQRPLARLAGIDRMLA
jgi:hypothetical protein